MRWGAKLIGFVTAPAVFVVYKEKSDTAQLPPVALPFPYISL